MPFSTRPFGGLTTEDITRVFLLPVAMLAQRHVRAEKNIRDAGIPWPW